MSCANYMGVFFVLLFLFLRLMCFLSFEWVVWNTNVSRMSHEWVTNDLCRRTSHVTYGWVTNESCHIWMSRVAHVTESCHMWMSHVTYKEVTFHRWIIFQCSHCKTPKHATTLCNTLQHSATLCNTRSATLCNTLQHSATLCNTLQHSTTHCNTLQHIATHYSTLTQLIFISHGIFIRGVKNLSVSVHPSAYCSTLQHTATHCSALQHTATHCSALQHTATNGNALQPTVAHFNTLQHIFLAWSIYQWDSFFFFQKKVVTSCLSYVHESHLIFIIVIATWVT